MRRLPRFWAALNAIPGWAADGLAWREQLGDEWPLASRYLRPTGRMVLAVACPSPGGDGCPRTVVRLPDGRLRAVCGESPRACDDLELLDTDAAVLALDRARLAGEISAALDAPSDGTGPPRRSALVPIGRHAVAAGISCPIVLLLGERDASLAEEALRSTALADEPGVVAVRTAATLPPATQARLRAAGHLILALADVLGVGETGRLQTVQPLEVILEAPRARLLRRLKEPERPPVWALPPDARWGELTLRLTSDQEIDCKFRGDTRKLTPEILRMRVSRSDKPNKDWSAPRPPPGWTGATSNRSCSSTSGDGAAALTSGDRPSGPSPAW
ncbi:hypothetical protein [Falsiroseomonas sp.]|uniref:hypothetical protein n=1 Tax=Falsiroseomonas sp. TaxID=2870721 RepID=UPI003561CFA7